jgi:hypothetical protein
MGVGANRHNLRNSITLFFSLKIYLQVLTAVVKNSSIFWDITSHSPLKVNRRFGGTWRLHLQGRRISQARNQPALLATCFHAGVVLDLFFDLEDGGDIFIRNVG